MKNFLARKWNSGKEKPAMDRTRGFMVTKIKILNVASFAATTPWFLGLENDLQGLGLQEGSQENAFFPCRWPGPGGVCLWRCHTDFTSGDFSPIVRLVSSFSYFMEHGFVTSSISGGNLA